MATTIVPIVALLLGILCGAGVVAFLFARRVRTDADRAREVTADVEALRRDLAVAEARTESAQARFDESAVAHRNAVLETERARSQHAERLELLQQERARLEQECVQARTSLTERDRQVEERDEQLRLTRDQLRGCCTDLEAVRRTLGDANELRAKLEQRAGDYAAREAEIAALRDVLAATQGALAERAESVAVLETRLRERDEQNRLSVDQLGNCTAELGSLRSSFSQVQAICAKLEQRASDYAKQESELAVLRATLAARQEELVDKTSHIAQLEQRIADDERLAAEKLSTLRAAQTQMEETFKGIAAQVLQHNTEKFEASTKLRLGELLQPLGERIKEFETKVQDTHKRDIEDRSTLHAELKRIVSTSQKLDQDARNLTKALKGDSKVQGAWGEVVLERVLEQSGLREGIEYVQQQSFKNNDGQCQRPDVIVHLPGQRDVVVDAKVSLTAYEGYCSSASEEDRAARLEDHVDSVRAHVKALSDKEYWRLQEVHTPDFVLMFVPIESAFIEALRCDPGLFEHAFRQRIVLTSPTTLLAVLKTIEHAWHVERHNESAREIVRQAGALYDKLRGFVDDLQQVGVRLNQAQNAYEGAVGKLSSGKGNVIARAERLRDLGVKVKRALPSDLTGTGPFDTGEDGIGEPSGQPTDTATA